MRSRSLPVSAIVSSFVLISTFAVSPVHLGAQESAQVQSPDPPYLVNTDPGTTEAYWTPERLATAKPMPVPEATGVAEVEPLTQPPEFTVSLPGAPPTLSAPSSNSQLFNLNLRELGESVEPGAYGTSDLPFTSSRLVTDAVAALGWRKNVPVQH